VAILPYIKQEIPIMIVFRALGFVADRSPRVLFKPENFEREKKV
jgi:hypothetical protein